MNSQGRRRAAVTVLLGVETAADISAFHSGSYKILQLTHLLIKCSISSSSKSGTSQISPLVTFFHYFDGGSSQFSEVRKIGIIIGEKEDCHS